MLTKSLLLVWLVALTGVVGEFQNFFKIKSLLNKEVLENENPYEKVVIEIDQGKLRGFKKNTYFTKKEYVVFQGVPYAEPPIGDLRFQPPTAALPWDGVYDGINGYKKCPQNDAFFDYDPQGDEDCLYLNVYTPHLNRDNDELLPVMFWIHSGGFTTGSGSAELYGPDFLIEENVVLVTINYRLGALGFMNLEDEYASGNMGLKDAVLALKWVKDNIEEFGGDKKQVTIFGNEAGGSMVSLLLHCNQAKGLFSKAICQSGVARMANLFDSNTKERAFALGRKLGKNVTSSDLLVRRLARIDLYEMAKRTPYVIDSTEVRDAQKSILPFAPSVETWETGAYITNFPEEFSAHNVSDIPIMIGFNSKESVTVLRDLVNSPDVLEKKDYNFQFQVPIRDMQFEYNSEDYKSVRKEIKKFYFDEGKIKDSSIDEYVDYISDQVFYPTDKTVQSYLEVKRSQPLFYYRFSYDGELNLFNRVILDSNPAIHGASNGDELCYLFFCNKFDQVYDYLQMNPTGKIPEEFMMIRKMARLWTNFAKYGNPTPGNNEDSEILGNLQWLPSTARNHQVLDIGKNMTMVKNPVEASVHFWDNLYGTFLIRKNSAHLFRDEL